MLPSGWDERSCWYCMLSEGGGNGSEVLLWSNLVTAIEALRRGDGLTYIQEWPRPLRRPARNLVFCWLLRSCGRLDCKAAAQLSTEIFILFSYISKIPRVLQGVFLVSLLQIGASQVRIDYYDRKTWVRFWNKRWESFWPCQECECGVKDLRRLRFRGFEDCGLSINYLRIF